MSNKNYKRRKENEKNKIKKFTSKVIANSISCC